MKLTINDGVQNSRKSWPMRSNQRIASWHKEVQALVSCVERAWVAAERMRAAVEECDPETCDPEGAPLNDGLKPLKLARLPGARTPKPHGSRLATES
jgi:hypothetical protein